MTLPTDLRPSMSPSRGVYLPVVHCFLSGPDNYAFFVRTGDVVKLSPAAFDALSLIEKGTTLLGASDHVRAHYSPAIADQVCEDLARLHQAGYLVPELEVTEDGKKRSYDALLSHRPRNIMFFVTEACNLACAYCYEKNQGVHDAPLTLKQVDARRVIDQYMVSSASRKDLCITFFGGEPLLNFAVIRDTVLYSQQRAPELGVSIGFTMTTNLTLLTQEIADFLALHRFHVMVSLDGPKEANDRYRVYRDGSGTYDVVVKNLRMLILAMQKAGARLPKIRATMTSMSLSAVDVDRHLRSLGTHLVEIGETHGTVEGARGTFDVFGDDDRERIHSGLDTEIDKIVAALEVDPESVPPIPTSFLKSLRKIHEEAQEPNAHQHAQPQLCGVCRNMKAVTPGGDLYPCHRYVGMPQFKLGNVHTGGVNPERVRKYYADINTAFDLKCTACWARHLCGGQCPWYLSREDGTIAPPDDATCDSLRQGFERGLLLYAILRDRFPRALDAIVSREGSLAHSISQAPDDACSI